MTDQTPSPADEPSRPVLLVPADPSQPTRIIDLDDGPSSASVLRAAVGGKLELQAHDEGDLWLNDEGRINNLPLNVRVSHWLINNSRRGRQRRVSESMIVYGDVVISGPPDRNANETAVRQEIVDHFENLHLTTDAMKDWDIRSTKFIIIDFPTPKQGPGGIEWNL